MQRGLCNAGMKDKARLEQGRDTYPRLGVDIVCGKG